MNRRFGSSSLNLRHLRVGELVKQNLGQIFLRNEAKLPNLETNTITVTEVKMSQDLKIANITCKYTPSNSVVFAYDGQVIGVGSGQQNRVDCVKLAGRKAETWFLRQHPKTLAFLDNFKKSSTQSNS